MQSPTDDVLFEEPGFNMEEEIEENTDDISQIITDYPDMLSLLPESFVKDRNLTERWNAMKTTADLLSLLTQLQTEAPIADEDSKLPFMLLQRAEVWIQSLVYVDILDREVDDSNPDGEFSSSSASNLIASAYKRLTNPLTPLGRPDVVNYIAISMVQGIRDTIVRYVKDEKSSWEEIDTLMEIFIDADQHNLVCTKYMIGKLAELGDKEKLIERIRQTVVRPLNAAGFDSEDVYGIYTALDNSPMKESVLSIPLLVALIQETRDSLSEEDDLEDNLCTNIIEELGAVEGDSLSVEETYALIRLVIIKIVQSSEEGGGGDEVGTRIEKAISQVHAYAHLRTSLMDRSVSDLYITDSPLRGNDLIEYLRIPAIASRQNNRSEFISQLLHITYLNDHVTKDRSLYLPFALLDHHAKYFSAEDTDPEHPSQRIQILMMNIQMIITAKTVSMVSPDIDAEGIRHLVHSMTDIMSGDLDKLREVLLDKACSQYTEQAIDIIDTHAERLEDTDMWIAWGGVIGSSIPSADGAATDDAPGGDNDKA